MNRLKKLQEFGQSVYMDEISRSMLTDGTLKTLIERDGLRGVTSNPAIFQKAITQSSDYDETIAQLQREGQSVEEVYEELVIADIQAAADLLRPVYDESDGRYGFVSLEVNPHLAFDTEATITEARHLWAELARPNVFIKVPGTEAGLPAIRQLIAEGINVNVTLLFGIGRYRQVANEYIAGLEERHASGQSVERVASVASFFLSRIDVMVDPLLEAVEREGGARGGRAADLKGKIAVANAKLAYRAYQEIFGSERFAKLAAKGARTQRVLWASTSAKNPAYSDTMYVEPLIGPDTVNTMPVDTLDAYRDHGEPASRVEEGVEEAAEQLRLLGELGIDIDEVTAKLEQEGVDKFVKPFDSLVQALTEAAKTSAQSELLGGASHTR
ncbi:MAG: transaldolase [Trueperaceae bacterium]